MSSENEKVWQEYPIPAIDDAFIKELKDIVINMVPKVPKVPPLIRCFDLLILNQKIKLNPEECLLILEALNIDESNFSKLELDGLSQLLIYYMKAWPAAEKVRELYLALKANGDFKNRNQIIAWYKEYMGYLYIKLKNTSNEVIKLRVHENETVKTTSKTKMTMTDENCLASTSAYNILIQGPPKFLSSIAFSIEGDDINAMQHCDKPWKCDLMMLKKFLNYPYIAVDVHVGDISFSRSNVHEFDRFLSVDNNITIEKLPDDHVEFEKLIDDKEEIKVFTQLFLEEYYKQFNTLLSAAKNVSEWRKLELQTVITEFLTDINEINSNKTIATNTSTCFIIGNSRFLRRKFMSGLNYYEVITPKILLTLRHFKGEQDMADNTKISFTSIRDYKSNEDNFTKMVNDPNCLSYSCNLCTKVFSTYQHISSHFITVHSEDQAVTCQKCKISDEIHNLAGKRWKHSHNV